MIMKLVRDGKRELEDVCDAIQLIRDRADFATAFKAFLASRALGAKPEATPSAGFTSIWRQVYAKLGVTADFSGLTIEDRPGYWPIVVLTGMTPQKIMQAIREANLFQTRQYAPDLDIAVMENDRDPKTGSYVVYVKATQEADPELKNLSANELKDRKIQGITILERILLEVFYFILSGGKHLDPITVTFCTGSRDSGGHVPSTGWLNHTVRVYYCFSGLRYDGVRARAVVS